MGCLMANRVMLYSLYSQQNRNLEHTFSSLFLLKFATVLEINHNTIPAYRFNKKDIRVLPCVCVCLCVCWGVSVCVCAWCARACV